MEENKAQRKVGLFQIIPRLIVRDLYRQPLLCEECN